MNIQWVNVGPAYVIRQVGYTCQKLVYTRTANYTTTIVGAAPKRGLGEIFGEGDGQSLKGMTQMSYPVLG